MLSTAVKAKHSPLRCPYCHDGVELSAPWVVCRGCLARHHSECWAMNSACAACRGADCLKDVPHGKVSVKVRGSTAMDQALDRLGQQPSLLKPLYSAGLYLASVLTAGLVPALVAEARLRHHARSHRRPSEGATFRPDALDATIQRSQRRSEVGLMIFAACALTAIVSGLTLGGSDHSLYGIASLTLFASTTTWVLTLLGLLITHHRAVRRHDASEVAFNAVDRGLDAEGTLRLTALHEDAWTSTAAHLGRGTGFSIFLSTVCFPIAYVTFPLWLARAFNIPIEVHERREKLGDLG